MAAPTTSSKASLPHRNPELLFSLIALALVALIGLGIWYATGFNFYWIWLVAVNAAAFFLYRFDKRRAASQNGRTRVPEVVLLGLMWLGGFAGAGMGMYMRPHHKTKKMRFVISLVLAAILHIVLMYWWLF